MPGHTQSDGHPILDAKRVLQNAKKNRHHDNYGTRIWNLYLMQPILFSNIKIFVIIATGAGRDKLNWPTFGTKPAAYLLYKPSCRQ